MARNRNPRQRRAARETRIVNEACIALARVHCIAIGSHGTTSCLCVATPADIVESQDTSAASTIVFGPAEYVPPCSWEDEPPVSLPVFGPELNPARYVPPSSWEDEITPMPGPARDPEWVPSLPPPTGNPVVEMETRMPYFPRGPGQFLFGPKDGPPRMPWWACLAPRRAERKYHQRVAKQLARANGRPRDIVGAIGSTPAAMITAEMRRMQEINPAAPGGMASISRLARSAVKFMETRGELPEGWTQSSVFSKPDLLDAAVAGYCVATEGQLIVAGIRSAPWYRRRQRAVAATNF